MPLLLLGMRFYNPVTGVFTQRDPVLDGLNWYSYVSGGVMTAVDPSGMAQIVDIFGPPSVEIDIPTGEKEAKTIEVRTYMHTCVVFNRPCLRGDDNKLYNSIGAFGDVGNCSGFDKRGGKVMVPDTRYNEFVDGTNYYVRPALVNNDFVFEYFLRACVGKHRNWNWTIINNCNHYAKHLWDCALSALRMFKLCVAVSLLAGRDSLVPCIKYAKDSIRCH